MKAQDHSVSGAERDDAPRWGLTGRRLTPKQHAQQQRRLRALQLQSEGKTFSEIADERGWSGPSGVAYAINKALQELRESGPVEKAEEIRYLNYWRLEALFQRVWPRAVGGWRDGEYVPSDLEYMNLARRIIADENKLTGVYDLPPAQGHNGSASHASATEPSGPEPILTTTFDMDRYRAAMARGERNEPISVDDQPPVGYIAPRPGDVDDETETVEMAPNSVDPVTGGPIFDPRAALKSD